MSPLTLRHIVSITMRIGLELGETTGAAEEVFATFERVAITRVRLHVHIAYRIFEDALSVDGHGHLVRSPGTLRSAFQGSRTGPALMVTGLECEVFNDRAKRCRRDTRQSRPE